MSELTERGKALLEGATPGPWQNVGYGNIQPETIGAYPPIGKIYGKGNQHFVAASRQLVPELIAEVERLEGELRNVAAIAFGGSADRAIAGQNHVIHESVLFTIRAALRDVWDALQVEESGK
ncbi:hypothetical protein R2325_16335 [Mycobacteroides chelonae]|jgi:hypothetical protein|uniref:hypothetical protein n=1 Tax=Mycobacteroides TaxID=670516 RepID=UPI00092963F5|nr:MULTISPECIES: hypothetical protein [Mycobacteroides]MBV6360422.1 hypothetical protein [Mycobacteroides chelonae]MEC4857143.1 hypothetical protein [Mycobacteroides chelonae]MEC4873553.1 hypothetical protein [Mycobacteroides chelonae]SHW93432.1 Bacteriophage protein [Mycobacteroides abscessus subsp. abscessus]SKL81313.1 Bacteriophage protein [Mycobacteroides abscessus subsp. abscessus]